MKRNKGSREAIQGLPPNIENAQPDVLSQVSDRWFNEMLALRAKRLNLAPDEAANVEEYKSQFQQSIAQLAQLQGITSEAYLEEYGRRIGRSTYPTPDCLTSNDVIEYSETATIPQSRREHVSSCSSCRTLLAVSIPSKDGFERVRDELRHLLSIEPEELPAQPPLTYPAISWVRRPTFLIPAALVLIAVVAPFLLKPASWVNPQTQVTGVLAAIVVLVGLRLLAVRKEFHRWGWTGVLKDIAPAGAVFASFLAVLIAVTLYFSAKVSSQVASLSPPLSTLSMAGTPKIPLSEGDQRLPSSIVSYANALRRQDRATALNAAALLEGNEENYDRGIQLASLAINTRGRDPELFNTRGVLYYKKSQYRDALQDFETAKALLNSSDEARSFRGMVLGNTAYTATSLGLSASAKDNFYSSIEAFPIRSPEKLHYLVGLGQLLLDTGNAQRARQKLGEALQLAQSLGDESGEADVHRSMAEVSHFLGDTSGAVNQVNLALHGHQTDVEKAIDVGILAKVEFDLGLPQAAEHAKESLSLSKSAGYQKGIGEQLHLQGQIAGQLDKAKADCNQALSIFSSLGYSRGEGEVYITLGKLQHEAAMQKTKPDETLEELQDLKPDFEASKEYFEKALDLFQSSGFTQGIVFAYGGIGSALAFTNPDKPEEAMHNFQQALDVANRIQYPLGRANQLGNLGVIYKHVAFLGPVSKREENLELAEADLEEALKIHRAIGFKLGEAKQLLNLADVARLRGPSYCAEARDRLGKSISILKDIGAGELLKRATDMPKILDQTCPAASNNAHTRPH